MKKLLAFLLVSCLGGCCSGPMCPPPDRTPYGPPPQAPDRTHYGEHYKALLKNTDLGCCIVVDTFHNPPQALKEGTSGLMGEFPLLQNTPDGALGMMLTAPPAGMPQGASMGVFLPGLYLGPGISFTMSATFRRPSTLYSDKNWSVGVVARSGDVPDLADLMRLQLTFRILKSTAELRVQEQWGPEGDDTKFAKLAAFPVPADVYDKIVNTAQPFTLKLSINRLSGSGSAEMTTGGKTYPLLSTKDMTPTFYMVHFKSDDGEPLTVVGASLANPSAPGEYRSVEVSDFEIWERP